MAPDGHLAWVWDGNERVLVGHSSMGHRGQMQDISPDLNYHCETPPQSRVILRLSAAAASPRLQIYLRIPFDDQYTILGFKTPIADRRQASMASHEERTLLILATAIQRTASLRQPLQGT